MLTHSIASPWSWQDDYGFVQAVIADVPAQMIFCAGQASVDSEGRPTNVGDPVAQFLSALANLEIVLGEAGATLADVVRLNYYVTDSQHYFAALPELTERLAHRGCRPASTMLVVSDLAPPDLMVEIEATALLAPRAAR